MAVLYLSATSRLTLYVHPRYVGFATVMAAFGCAASLLAVVLATGGGHAAAPDHQHRRVGAGHGPEHTGRVRRAGAFARVTLLLATGFALLVLPPATLSATLRQARTPGSLSPPTSTGTSQHLVGGDPRTFSVRDWALLIRDGQSGMIVGKQARLQGYVLDSEAPDAFRLSRLVITCCAVDAQPVSVVVLDPGWQYRHRTGDWVEVAGTFVRSTSPTLPDPFVLKGAEVRRIGEPDQPYVY